MSRNKVERIERDISQPSSLRQPTQRVAARPNSSGLELFGQRRFACAGTPRYFGTGVPGYSRGPGFTGGYYGYGAEDGAVATLLSRSHAASQPRLVKGTGAVGSSRAYRARSWAPQKPSAPAGLLDPAA
jgi:hypothetical protein